METVKTHARQVLMRPDARNPTDLAGRYQRMVRREAEGRHQTRTRALKGCRKRRDRKVAALPGDTLYRCIVSLTDVWSHDLALSDTDSYPAPSIRS